MNALLERKAAVSVPLRGYVFLNMKKFPMITLSIVSVPLRGYVFLNVSDIWLYNTRYNSFRPLTGICFSKSCWKIVIQMAFPFPSPYGDMFF